MSKNVIYNAKFPKEIRWSEMLYNSHIYNNYSHNFRYRPLGPLFLGEGGVHFQVPVEDFQDQVPPPIAFSLEFQYPTTLKLCNYTNKACISRYCKQNLSKSVHYVRLGGIRNKLDLRLPSYAKKTWLHFQNFLFYKIFWAVL